MALENFPRIDDYGDATAEAMACRTDCALFDFSFLECARLAGPGARGIIETFTGRSVGALAEGKILYALRLGPASQAVADLTVWRTGDQSFEVMSGRREEVVDLLAYAAADLDAVDMTAERAVFSVQGPGSLDSLRRLGDVAAVERLQYFHFCHCEIAGVVCRIGRLGYTGEAGFELVVARRCARELWQALSGRIRPAGFIAVDMLRIEAGFVLFQNEFRLPVSPREAGLGRFCRSANMPPPALALISFRADAGELRLPWTPLCELRRPVSPGEIAVTSACESVVAGGILGLGYVLAGTSPAAKLHDPTAAFSNIRTSALPFYDNAKRRPRAPWR